MCCPSVRGTLAFAQLGKVLVEVQPGDAAPGEALDLVGATWRWVEFRGGDDSLLDVDEPDRYTLTLMPDGHVALQVDCNRATGAYALEGESLQLKPGPM